MRCWSGVKSASKFQLQTLSGFGDKTSADGLIHFPAGPVCTDIKLTEVGCEMSDSVLKSAFLVVHELARNAVSTYRCGASCSRLTSLAPPRLCRGKPRPSSRRATGGRAVFIFLPKRVLRMAAVCSDGSCLIVPYILSR